MVTKQKAGSYQARVRPKLLRRGILRDNLAMNTFELVAPESKSTASPALADMALKEIERLDSKLSQTFEGSFVRSAAFNRTLVSFQANRDRPVYRWYKFKEGFSASLIEYLITSHNIKRGARLLDPFAGSGTSLFVGSSAGLQTKE